MYEEQHFTRDAAVVRFHDDADGITVDEDDVQFDWDAVETVTIDEPPHAEAFDSKKFYKLPATVAKPIAQPYDFGNDSITWLKKPREELKKAAWSLDNAPWTMGHPDSGMVKSVDDVRGFWRNPRYIDGLDDLDADMHIPVGDEEAKEYIEENNDVSVGFYNRIARTDDYDGIVGGSDDDGVDVEGYQTDMLFDHVASVSVGRCPGSEGCGIDSHTHGHVDSSFKGEDRSIHSSDEGGNQSETDGQPLAESADSGEADGDSEPQETDSMQATDAGREIDGTWYAVPPEDTDGDEPKYPIRDCSDVGDAWHLRGHAEGLTIEQSTLESRIKDRADSLGCDIPGEEGMEDSIEEIRDRYMCNESEDCGCNENDSTTMELNFDDLSTEAALAKVEEQHDGVSEHLDKLRQYEDAAEEAEEAADELGLDDVQDLSDSVGVLKDEKESLSEELDEARRPQMEEDAEFIAERTDRFGDDAEDVIEHLDEDPDTIADKRELVEDLTEGYDEQTANSGDGDSEPTKPTTGGYAKTPWDN